MPRIAEDSRDLIHEHERLVRVLRSPSHADDLREAQRQAKELRKYRQKKRVKNWPLKKPAPQGRPAVALGDELYFQHPQRGPTSGKVLCHGAHGVTLECAQGQRHQVRWDRLLGAKQRLAQDFAMVDQGEDGAVLEDAQGQRRFLQWPAPATRDENEDKDEKAEAPLKKARPPQWFKGRVLFFTASGLRSLRKTFIQGYVRRSGTFVLAHQDKRRPAQAADKTARQLGGTLIGTAIPNDLLPVTGINLLDQQVHTPDDLARLCQIYRNPFYETFRVFFVRHGRIVGQCGVSARMPTTTPIPQHYELEINQQTERLNAEQVWLVHNHPSGDPEPSAGDQQYTFTAEKGLRQFAGHIIINNGKYSTYSPKTGWTVNAPLKPKNSLDTDFGGGLFTYNLENVGNFGKPHNWLMKSPDDQPGALAEIAKQATLAPDNVILTSVVALPGKLRAIAELAATLLADPEQVARRINLSATGQRLQRQRDTAMTTLKLFARQTGATQGMYLFCPHAHREDYGWLYESNTLRDVLSIDPDGHLRSLAADFPDLRNPGMGSWLGPEAPQSELVEAFFTRMGYA